MNDTSIGEPVNSAAFAAFYESSLREIVFKVSIGAMMLVYLCALIAGVRSIMNNKEGLAVILVQLYVIGGGAFQLIWESLSRYCLGYFIFSTKKLRLLLPVTYSFAVVKIPSIAT